METEHRPNLCLMGCHPSAQLQAKRPFRSPTLSVQMQARVPTMGPTMTSGTRISPTMSLQKPNPDLMARNGPNQALTPAMGPIMSSWKLRAGPTFGSQDAMNQPSCGPRPFLGPTMSVQMLMARNGPNQALMPAMGPTMGSWQPSTGPTLGSWDAILGPNHGHRPFLDPNMTLWALARAPPSSDTSHGPNRGLSDTSKGSNRGPNHELTNTANWPNLEITDTASRPHSQLTGTSHGPSHGLT
jgi:hypothetical protein